MIKQTSVFALLLSALGAPELLGQFDRRIAGEWTGTRSERNPFNGQTYTIDFAFEFLNNGTYQQVARFGRLTILKLEGKYTLQPGRKPGDPSFTHILRLIPGIVQVEPSRDELRLLRIAGLPDIEPVEEFALFYNLAPSGALTLQDRNGGSSWGLQRVR